MAQRVTIKADLALANKIKEAYKQIAVPNDGEYIFFFAKKDRCTITVYSSKKENEFKASFIGEDSLKEAKKFDESALVAEVKEKTAPTKASWILLTDQIGSDEVGTGDFFGPICVCAAYVKKSDIKRLRELGVDDSKRLSDDQIRKLGEILTKEFEYSQVSLDNVKYNELVEKNMNMNEMKVKMHNQVLLNLKKKHKAVKDILVDQFAPEKTFYSYLFGEKNIVEGITFKTKGESYFPSVAVGSIIARYSFLLKMDAISKKYKMEIPFGASNAVTEFAKKFVKKYGVKELDKIVKKNFANYKELAK